MKLNALMLALMAMVIVACQNNKFTTESGVEVEYVVNKESAPLIENDVLMLNVTYYSEDSSVSYDYKKTGGAFPARYNEQNWSTGGSYYEVLKQLGEGDSVTFEISAKEFFNLALRRPLPDSISPEAPIRFHVGVEEVMPIEDFQAIRREEILEKQLVYIDQYLDDKGLEANRTESGLSIVTTEKGEGVLPEIGDLLQVHYRGAFMNDTVFDASFGKEPFEFTLGQGQVISGWDEGFGLINVGTKATLYVPSALAYGERGYPNVIPPNAILKFDIELLEIKN